MHSCESGGVAVARRAFSCCAAARTMMRISRSNRSSIVADVDRRSTSSQPSSGIELIDVPPPIRLTDNVVRGDFGSGSDASIAAAAAAACTALGMPNAAQLWPPAPRYAM